MHSADTRTALSSRAAVLVLLVLFLAAGCVAYRWRAEPVTSLELQQENVERRLIELTTSAGPVRLTVDRVEHPFVFGRIAAGIGVVEIGIDSSWTVSVATLDARDQVAASRPVPFDDLLRDPGSLVGQPVWLFRRSGEVVVLREVTRVELPWVEGRLHSHSGAAPARVDLSGVTQLSVHEVDGLRTALNVAAGAGAVAATVALIGILTKESCPFVYVDRGRGWEFVGEAYAGAAFRSTQRDDLLPLPAPGDAATMRVRLRNEARETQFTDLAELVLVDHPRDARALSTVENRVVLVGPARPALWARETRAGDVGELVARHDEQWWETDPVRLASVEDDPLEDVLVAELPLPSLGAPVLEIVGGNTAFLDVVFGRFFAAMGDRLAGYLTQGNDSAAGPRIQRWREREGVDLTIEVREGERWRPAAVVPTVGPAALREIAIPLGPALAESGGTVTIRVRGGLGFWRIDRLAISGIVDTAPATQVVAAREATMEGARDELDRIARRDERYNVLHEMFEELDVMFPLPPAKPGAARSAFLLTNGYYNVHPPVQSRWMPGTLRAIRDEPGGFSRFGRDLARGYLAAESRGAANGR